MGKTLLTVLCTIAVVLLLSAVTFLYFNKEIDKKNHCPDYNAIVTTLEHFNAAAAFEKKELRQGMLGHRVRVASPAYKELNATIKIKIPNAKTVFFPDGIFDELYVAAKNRDCDKVNFELASFYF